MDRRAGGILLHPTSLPGGKLGDEAFRFVDWLAEAGQSWWQILPLGPPDESGSPYRAASAFACWNGLLADPNSPVTREETEEFVARNPYWTGSWASYAGEDAIADQVRFDREWGALRRYAAERGVRLIGDLPIYVAPGGADERGWPELFERGRVSGVPPDDWSATGQLWGNPLPLVDRAVPPHLRPRRRDAHRPFPRVRRILVGQCARENCAPRCVAPGAWAALVRCRTRRAR